VTREMTRDFSPIEYGDGGTGRIVVAPVSIAIGPVSLLSGSRALHTGWARIGHAFGPGVRY